MRATPTWLLRALAAAILLSSAAGAEAKLPRKRAPVATRAAPRAADPEQPVSLDDFVAALEPLGDWYLHSKWGRAWKPGGVDPDWKPYRKGRWSHTAEGWYWVSDEPWGWATYHFGRWFVDPLAGWTWVPGKQWAPAWVVWREGKGLVGWAPLGPDGKVLSPNFQFIPAAKLGEPVEGVLLHPSRTGEALMSTKVLERAPRPPARPPRVSAPPRLAGGE